MTNEAMENLRERIRSVEVRNGRRRFTAALREEILEYSRSRRAAGFSISAIAAELELNDWTLGRWHSEQRKAGAARAISKVGFVEVSDLSRKPGRAVPHQSGKATSERFEVICPNGFEVRIPMRFDASALGQVLRAVENR